MNRKIEMQNNNFMTRPGGEPAQHQTTPPHPCIFSVLGDSGLQKCKGMGGYKYQISSMEIQNINNFGGAVVE